MNETLRRIAFVSALSLSVTACVNDPPGSATSSMSRDASSNGAQDDVGYFTYRAVDRLLAAAPEVGASTPLAVGSVSDAQDVDRSTALGNIVVDLIRTRLAQDGRIVLEMRLRRSVGIRMGQGEFVLSRNRQALMPPPEVGAIVTGTYAASHDLVYVSLKLVSATDSRIVAGADFAVSPADVDGLLTTHTSTSAR